MANNSHFTILLAYFALLYIGVYGDLRTTTFFGGKTYKWTHNTKLPSGMEVSWIDSDPEFITFAMKGPEKGYISIGFSPSGGMAGADMFVGWVDSNGMGHLLDMHGTHNGMPILDKIQDLELLGAKEDDTGTLIIFKRKWDTCDDEDFPIGDDTMRLIWATGPTDPSHTPKGYSPLYHGNDVLKRGVKSTFMKVLSRHKKFPDDEDVYPAHVYHADLTVTNVTVPKAETYYHCKILKFPKLTSKHHIIAHRPLIAPPSIPHIHHINVYKCHIPEILRIKAGDIFEKYLDHPGGDCYTEESPREWTEYCFEFRIVIGVGSEGDILPAHIGDVIGDTDGPTYYRIEVHYENPQGKQLIDNSGIRVFYTSVLREYEMGVLFAGHRRTPFLTIPPHQKEYTTYGFCGAECTSRGFPKDGIKIISVLLHAHLTGRKIILRHIRNGKELPPIAQDNHVDFNYQHYRMLKKEVIVLPGDELITACTYDTEKNSTFVYGGLSTRREMCESFIVFYPKTTLIDCRSQPEYYTYFGAIGVQNATGKMLNDLHLPFNSRKLPIAMQDNALADDSMVIENGRTNELDHDIFREIVITHPKELEGFDVHDYMMNLNWYDTEFVKSVEERRKSGYHYMHCSAPGGKKILTSRDAYPFPVYEPYEAPPKLCLSSGSTVAKPSNSLVLEMLMCATVTIWLANIR
ncbi:unnamed protein product [Orchesella dallaii]|uniref:DOMON domain-containing protein n=1 Tax=Orchesella dallaii TaxID=48710 RepID=A0ABP1PNG1_9HEXA